MLRIFSVILICLASVTSAQQNGANPIIAFDSKRNLTQCLDRVTSIAQLQAANDGRIIRGGNCSFGAPRVAFDAYNEGFHETNLFIFPIFRLVYVSDNINRYANDGVFNRSNWYLVRQRGNNACSYRQMSIFGGCLLPKRCEYLRAFNRQVETSQQDGYIRQPANCTRFFN